MRQLVITAFKDAVAQIESDMALMPIARWNESVFRFMYSRAVTQTASDRVLDVRQFFECERVDLVLHHQSERAFVEFKFCIHSPKYKASLGESCGWKGYPSDKNLSEFTKCVRNLRERSVSPDALKLVALFYADPINTKAKKYEDYYGDRRRIGRELRIRELASIGPFSPNGLENCKARLYEIGT